MRDWLKGIFGAVTALPQGITPEWVSELRRLLGEGQHLGAPPLTGENLDAAVEFVLRGQTGGWKHPNPPPVARGTIIGFNDRLKRPARPGFYAALDGISTDVLLRWAEVLEASAGLNKHSQLYMPFPGGIHWPELVLLCGAGNSLNMWPLGTQQQIAYATLERMLVAAGMEPHALLVHAFATPVDSGYGANQSLAAVSYCPDFAQALDRHLEAVRPLLLTGSPAQRVHMLTLLSRAGQQVRDRLAAETAELAVGSVKQVRVAADGFVQSAGEVMIPVLRRLALEGKPEQRLYALRYLHQRGQTDQALLDFAQATAKADKAASVQALLGEWASGAAADAAPEAQYDIVIPTIAWDETPQPNVLARLDRLWEEINRLIRTQNQRARDHYEKYKTQHGQPKWQVQVIDEIPSSWLEDLQALLNSGAAPPRQGPKPLNGLWHSMPALRNLASEPVLKPTELFKLLHQVGYLFDHNDHLNYWAVDCFNRLYASTGRPLLIELATLIGDTGRDPSLVLRAFCAGRFGCLGRGWRDEDVWPYIAQQAPVLERYLQGLADTDFSFDRTRVYDAIAALPVPPARIVNALFGVALGSGKSERQQAQEALANLPDKERRIIAALSDGKSEVRAVAAQWLRTLQHLPALSALEKAVAVEQHDNAKGAMLDALEALGQPVDKYLARDLLLPQAKKALAKGLPKDLSWLAWSSLPVTQWADTGDPVAPEILQWMIAQACRANSPEPNAVLRKYCKMFEYQGRERLGQWVLEQWLAEDTKPISGPNAPGGSAIGSKGILAIAAACAGERAAAPAGRYIKDYYGMKAAQCRALVAMLAWIDHPSATQVMLAIGNRFRTKSIQEEASRQAQALAERKGWTLAELADRTIPTAGLDDNGELELSYGPRAFKARLLPDFKVELLNPEGKKIASLPEPRQDDDHGLAQTSKKALSASKKEIKSIVDLQTERFYEALCTGRAWVYADWRTYLNSHPVVRHLVQRLVWVAESESGARSAFRPLADGSLTKETDDAVEVPEQARVRLAHDTLLTPDAMQAWQQHLLDYEIKPLFQQLGKGIYELPSDQADATSVTDFKGHVLEAFALRGRANKLGYQRGSAEDGGWFTIYEKRFPTLELSAVLQFTGNTLPEENRSVALIGLAFSQSSPENRFERGEIPLNKIPGVLLSECYNDLRLIAAEGTGFDPDWEKKSAY